MGSEMCIRDRSDVVVTAGRFRVVLLVESFDGDSARLVFPRIKIGETQQIDALTMQTCVYVKNPVIFKKCLEWKEKDTRGKWANVNF